MGSCFFYQSVIIAAAIASIIRITVMAFVTCGGMQCLGMAGPAAAAAMVHAAAALIGNPRVRTAVFCRPIVNCMAGSTIQSEQAGMVGRVTMTAIALGG